MKDLEIFKGNHLIQAKPTKHLTAREKKLVSYMVASINPYDDDYKEYSFPVTDFARFFNITDKNVNKEYEKIAKGILSKPFTVDTPEETFTVSWLSEATYVKECKEIRWRYTPKLKPYLIRLKKYYTKYRMINLIHLDNCHSESIYELLKQHEKLGHRDITIDELRDYLALQKKYPLYSNLKAKVIAPAVAEINQFTDINCSYKECKKGRKIVSLKFSIWSDPNNKYIQQALAVNNEESSSEEKLTLKEDEEYQVPETVPEQYQDVVKELVEGFGFIIEEALPLAHRYGAEYIMETLKIVEERISENLAKGKAIQRIASYAKKIIEDNFKEETGVERRLREKGTQDKESKALSCLKTIERYLDELYPAWYKKELRAYAELAVGMHTEAFSVHLERSDDLFAGMARDAVKRNGIDLSDNVVYTAFTQFLSQDKNLESQFSKERFMQNENFVVENRPDGALLFKNGHRLEL